MRWVYNGKDYGAVCTDRSVELTGKKAGFQGRVKSASGAPIALIHCINWRPKL